MIRHLLRHVLMHGEVKLTKVGNLPPSLAKDLYAQGFILDDAIEHGITTLSKETDCNAIVLMRSLCELSGLVKNRSNTLSLTKKSLSLIESGELFPLIFKSMCTKFSWAFFDGYENEQIGQAGCSYSLYLLAKYGNVECETTFYSEKYFAAFPDLMTEQSPNGSSDSSHHCYEIRTFVRFLEYFGFISFTGNRFNHPKIKKTPLFTECVSINL